MKIVVKRMFAVSVIGMIFFALVIDVGLVEGKNNFNSQGDYNMSFDGIDAADTGGGECGGCHVEAVDTISVTWTGSPDTTLSPGQQIDVNFTVDLTTSRAKTDDFFACLLMNSTVRTTTERPMDPEIDGWTIDKDADGGVTGYNLVTPYTNENGATGPHHCNWTVTAPNINGDYILMGMSRWGTGVAQAPVMRNTSVTFTVSSASEFPPVNPLVAVLPPALSISLYLMLKRRVTTESLILDRQ